MTIQDRAEEWLKWYKQWDSQGICISEEETEAIGIVTTLLADNTRLRSALETIADPYLHKWYKSANDGDEVVDAMIELSRVTLEGK